MLSLAKASVHSSPWAYREGTKSISAVSEISLAKASVHSSPAAYREGTKQTLVPFSQIFDFDIRFAETESLHTVGTKSTSLLPELSLVKASCTPRHGPDQDLGARHGDLEQGISERQKLGLKRKYKYRHHCSFPPFHHPTPI